MYSQPTPDTRAGPQRRPSPFLIQTLALAALGTIVSVLACLYTRREALLFDETYYYSMAEGIVRGSFQDGYIIRPPLYPLFLAGIFTIVGAGMKSALVVQSVLRGVLVVGVSYLGRRWLSRPAGLLGAALVAIQPLLVFTYTRFVSEIVYIPLFVLSVYFVDRALETERRRDMAVAGLVCGLATLARPTSFFFTIGLAAWTAMRKSPRGRFSRVAVLNGATLAAALFAAILPWTVRNAVVHHAFIPVDNATAFNLYLITSGKQIKEVTEEWTSWGGQAERQAEGYRRYFAYIRQAPGYHLRRMATVFPKLVDPRRQPELYSLSTLVRGQSTRQMESLRGLIRVLSPAVFWILVGCGTAGVIVLERSRSRRALLLVALAYFVLIHATTLARPRFLLPLTTLLACHAGGFTVWGLSRLGSTMRGRP